MRIFYSYYAFCFFAVSKYRGNINPDGCHTWRMADFMMENDWKFIASKGIVCLVYIRSYFISQFGNFPPVFSDGTYPIYGIVSLTNSHPSILRTKTGKERGGIIEKQKYGWSLYHYSNSC